MTRVSTALAPAALIAVSACMSLPPAGPDVSRPSSVGAVAIGTTPAGYTEDFPSGIYLCTTAERAAIASQHREGAGPPSALVDHGPPTTFKMQITPTQEGSKQYKVVEMDYDGSDRDRAEWQDENSVLHSTYVGDGSVFHAVDGPAFLTFNRGLYFYHAGFEYLGGEDTQLAVRWGRCRRVQ